METISKYDFVSNLIQLFDQIDELKRENADLRRDMHAIEIGDDAPAELSAYDRVALEEGRNKILDSSLYSYCHVKVERDANGNLAVQPFERWLEMKTNEIPHFMSHDGFMEYFAADLKERYEKEKEAEIAYFLESEKEEQAE